jgi:hypothetical protein
MTKQMTKTLYEVHRNGRLVVKYVTHTRNCEEMLKGIIELHHRVTDDVFIASGFKVVRIIGKERTVIYTPKLRNFWQSKELNLVD